MRKVFVLSFFPIVMKKDQATGLPTLEMDESEVNVLWAICKHGPKSIYDLQVKTRFSLQQSNPTYVWARLPDRTVKEAKAKLGELQKPKSYQRTSIYKILKKLLAKNLVKLSKDTSGNRIKMIVEPTLQGLILYLQSPFDEGKLEDVLDDFSHVFPFSDKWKSMTTVLGKEKCIQALERTIKDFVEIQRASFLLRPLKMKFEAFLESPRMFLREVPEVQVIRERDMQVAQYLMGRELTILRDSYIAYLALRDIRTLSGEGREETERMIPDMESEKELAYLEHRDTDTNSIFKHKRLKEFLRARARSIDCFH